MDRPLLHTLSELAADLFTGLRHRMARKER
jgi:hypothetical protein